MDTIRFLSSTLFLSAFVACTGCASGALIVSTGPSAGRIETWGPVSPSHQKARTLLVDHCGSRFSLKQVAPTPAAASANEGNAKPQLRHYEFSCNDGDTVIAADDDITHPALAQLTP